MGSGFLAVCSVGSIEFVVCVFLFFGSAIRKFVVGEQPHKRLSFVLLWLMCSRFPKKYHKVVSTKASSAPAGLLENLSIRF